MARAQHDSQGFPEERQLGPFERWTTDENGEATNEWDEEAHRRWCAKRVRRCPDGHPQRLRRALGFRERNVAELELRVPLGGDDRGVCEVILDERDDEVYVRVLVCYEEADDEAHSRSRDYVDCPVRVWLERPLGERAVIDVDSDEELPLFIPAYLDNVPQPDHGYHPVTRRRRAPR
jgi:hypothetical protein